MPSIEERVAYLEGQVTELSPMLADIRETARQTQRQIQELQDRVTGLQDRVTGMVSRVEFREAVTRLDDKMDRQFLWLVGIQMTTLAAIVASIVGALVALAPR